MKIDNEFKVSVPIERAWEVLTDLRNVAPCMPGAKLTGVEDGVYAGQMKIKVGPVISEYAGTAEFIEQDDATHHAVIDAKGKDRRGAGNASAQIDARCEPLGDHTRVIVSTDMKITGKIAQLGSGMIKEVSTKLLGQFVQNLEARLAQEDSAPAEPPPAEPPPAEPPSAPGAPAGDSSGAPVSATPAAPSAVLAPVPARAGQPVPAADEDPEPLDLLKVAGGSLSKRLAPAGVGLIALIVIIWFWRR